MIDAVAIAKIASAFAGFWALGYGVGKSVGWVRKIRDVA